LKFKLFSKSTTLIKLWNLPDLQTNPRDGGASLLNMGSYQKTLGDGQGLACHRLHINNRTDDIALQT
jgi:hypothetical protein